MKIKNSFLFILASLVFMSLQTSCNTKLNDEEFIKYTKDIDNNIHQTRTIGDWVYDVQYKPSRLIILNERLTSPGEILKRKEQLEGTVWFNISIKHVKENSNPLKYKVSGIEEYNTRLDYFLNGAREEISLNYGNKKLKPFSYLFENNYGLTPNETMVVGFEIPDRIPCEEMTLVYNDHLLKNGIVKLLFTKKDTKKINLL